MMTQQVMNLFGDGVSEKKVIRITPDEAKPFLLNVHYARRVPQIMYAFGVVVDGSIVGCVTYGYPPSPKVGEGITDLGLETLELNRLAILPSHREKNLASFLVGQSLKMLPDSTYVVSYADAGGWHHVGYVYQATNWIYTGMTAPRVDKAPKAGYTHSRHYDRNTDLRVARTEKHRYVYCVCKSRSFRKKMIEHLTWEQMPYPKGESRHYDTEHPVPIVDATKQFRKAE